MQRFGPTAAVKSRFFKRNLKYLTLKKIHPISKPIQFETNTLLLSPWAKENASKGSFWCESYPSNVVREIGHTQFI